MHATRKLVFPSGPIDVTGTFQVESEAISNEKRFRWKDFQTTHPRIVKVKKASFQPCSLFRGQSRTRSSTRLDRGKLTY
ncbi:hypothetical protein ACFX2G_029333 [Malus domestica]